MSLGIYGDTTRELHRAWTKCLQQEQGLQQQQQLQTESSSAEDLILRRTLHSKALQPLFNEVNLFPSQSQIFEMVQCAHECTMLRSKSLSESSSCCSSSGESLPICMTPPGSSGKAKDAASQQQQQATGVVAAPDVRRNSLTFGEFCIFATELRKYYRNFDSHGCHHSCYRVHLSRRHPHRQHPQLRSALSAPASTGSQSASAADKVRRSELLRTQKSSASAYDVFLGGSCNPTTWRQDVAIPHLKGQGITYYNPQQSNWVPEMIELEHQAKQTSQIILLVMNEQTRNVVSNIEACYLAGARRQLMVVINHYPRPGHMINNDSITQTEFDDLEGALTTVHDLVERQGLPVFGNLPTALNCTSKVLKEGVSIESLSLKDDAQPVKLGHLQIGDKLVRLREAFDTLDTTRCGRLSLADICMAFRIHTHCDLSQKDLKQIIAAHDVPLDNAHARNNAKNAASLPLDQVMVDFDHFCCIVSEFRNNPGAKGGRGSGENRFRRRGKVSRVIRSMFQPFHRLAAWIATGSGRPGGGTPPLAHRQQQLVLSSSAQSAHIKRRGSQLRDVYLGGTMLRGSNWREKEAIPVLKKHGLTFFTPSSPTRRLIPLETAAMDNSRVLLFVIEGSSRSVSAMCEAAYYIGQGAPVVLCVQKIPEDALIAGERLTKAALKDYNRGRCYLSDFANREGVPVFEEVSEAVECVLQKSKSLR